MVILPIRPEDSLLEVRLRLGSFFRGGGCLQSAMSKFFVIRNLVYTRTATASVATTMVKINTK